MKKDVNTRNQFGLIDTSEKGRKRSYARFMDNREKPWPGMRWFAQYGVYAINEKNAIRKSKRESQKAA